MNIVFTKDSLQNKPGGAERSMVNLANELSAKGHDVSIVLSQKNTSRTDETFYQISSFIKIYNIYPQIDFSVTIKKKTPILKRLIKKIKTFIIYYCGNMFWDRAVCFVKLKFLTSYYSKRNWHNTHDDKIKRLKKTISNINPDIVISFLPESFTFVAQALKKTNIPLIIANRNDPRRDYTLNRCSSKYDLMLRLKAPEIAAANLVQIEEFKYFFSKDVQKKTYVIPNFVLPADEKNIASSHREKEEMIILSVARLHDTKNQELLIKGFKLLSSKYPKWGVKIFGTGEKTRIYALENLINELGLEEKVLLMEIAENIYEEYRKSHIFVLTSIFEGFSNALTEAMAHGLPCIVIEDCISNRKLVSEAQCGFVTKNSVEDFAAKIEYLINNPLVRQQFALHGMSYIRKYNKNSILELWDNMINAVIAKQNEKLT